MSYPNLGPMRPIVNINWPGRYIAVRFREDHGQGAKGGPLDCSPSSGVKPPLQGWTKQYLESIQFGDIAPLSALLTTNSGDTWQNVFATTTFAGLPSTSEVIGVSSPWQWDASPGLSGNTKFFPIAEDSDLPIVPQSGGTEVRFGRGTGLIIDIYWHPRDMDFELTCWSEMVDDVSKDYMNMITTLVTTGEQNVAASKSFTLDGFEATHDGRTYTAFAVQAENNDSDLIDPDFEREFWVLMKPKPPAAEEE